MAVLHILVVVVVTLRVEVIVEIAHVIIEDCLMLSAAAVGEGVMMADGSPARASAGNVSGSVPLLASIVQWDAPGGADVQYAVIGICASCADHPTPESCFSRPWEGLMVLACRVGPNRALGRHGRHVQW